MQKLEAGKKYTWDEIEAMQEEAFNKKSETDINYADIRDEVLRKKEEGVRLNSQIGAQDDYLPDF